MTRLIVEAVHRIPSRPWILVTGLLEGDALRIGDEMTVTRDGLGLATTVVRSIELHGPPGRTTVAVDAALAEALQDGVVLVRA